MRILILGGSGFVGQHLANELQERGYGVTITSRADPAVTSGLMGKVALWDGKNPQELVPYLSQCQIIINLLGANISSKRWTKAYKQEILHSRLRATKALVTALQYMKQNQIPLPNHLIQASACGYYGLWPKASTAPTCTEHTLHDVWQDVGKDLEEELAHMPTLGFLAHVCTQWEEATNPLTLLGMHVCIMRFAPILGRHAARAVKPCSYPPMAGLLNAMLPPFRYGLGGVVGSGEQPMSWIHAHDATKAVVHAIEHTSQGHYVVSSPQITTMRDFVHTLSQVLNKPAFMRVPSMAARLILGEMAEELILNGQKCFPQRLTDENFHFTYGTLDACLKACLCLDKTS